MRYRVREGQKVKLGKWPTSVKATFRSDEEYDGLLNAHIAEMRRLQELLYATRKCALLIILQGMDAAGKDSTIKHVMSGVNPQGCQVFSFKHPSATELLHDFLWRTTRDLPERGRIGIFNRSYYEEVLIARVHPEILVAEGLPRHKHPWEERYESIVDFERHLHRNGTKILKFFLHLSPKEQKKRFLERLDKPEKNFKFDPADLRERAYWKQYMKAYEHCLSATSTKESPWFVVPADDKPMARLIVSRAIVEALRDLELKAPRPDARRKRELEKLRRALKRDDASRGAPR